jgi:sugar phosphate isomerase/epimerase
MATSSYHPRVSASGISSFGWTIDEELAFYGDAGITAMGVLLMKSADDLAGVVDKVRAAGMRASSTVASTAGVTLVATEGGAAAALDALRPSIDAAAALDGAPCYFTSGRTPPRMPTEEAFELLVPVVADATAYARERGVPLALEHNSTSTRDNGFVHTLADAVDLARETGLGICVELQNCWFERGLRRTFAEHAERFVVVQVSDFKVGETTRLNRAVPGDGDMPLEWLIGSLLDGGYGGFFELEVLGPRIEEEGYPAAIRRGLDWISERLARWGA